MTHKHMPPNYPTIMLRELNSFEELNSFLREFVRNIEEIRLIASEVTESHATSLDAYENGEMPVLTDATRGSPGTAGRVIFNTDDGQLNIDDGTNWTLPDGTTT